MKSNTYEKATASLHVRLRPSEKEKLVQKIKACGFLSITEFITHSIHNNVVSNIGYRREFLTALHLLAAEINRIGININQVVHLMHQDKLTGDIHASSLQQFNALLKTYYQSRDEIKSLFQQIISGE